MTVALRSLQNVVTIDIDYQPKCARVMLYLW